MGENRSVAPMRAAKIGYIVLSVLFCLLGAALWVWPKLSTLLFGRFLGVCMVLFGVVKLVGYFSKDLYRLAFQYDLAFGILLLALGVVALTKPDSTIHFFGILIGVCVLTDGLFKVQMSMDAKAFGLPRWWLILLLALLSCGFGVALVFRPGESLPLLTALLGLSLFSEGLLNLCVAVSAVKIVPHQVPDVIDVDDYTVHHDPK